MIGVMGSGESRSDRGRLRKLGSAFFECLFEIPEFFPYMIYALIPIFCIATIYFVGVVVYQLIFDPSAVAVAARLDLLSIDPDKWSPRA